MFWVDGKRDDLNIGGIFIGIIHIQHVALHNGANGRAGGEKEIGYINIMLQVFAAYTVAVLIHKFKSRYALINCIGYLLAVNGFSNSLSLAVNGEFFLAT